MPISIGTVERLKTISSNYIALITDDSILADATSGNIVVTLPSAASKTGKVIKIIKTDSSVNTVTVSGIILPIINSKVHFVSNGAS